MPKFGAKQRTSSKFGEQQIKKNIISSIAKPWQKWQFIQKLIFPLDGERFNTVPAAKREN